MVATKAGRHKKYDIKIGWGKTARFRGFREFDYTKITRPENANCKLDRRKPQMLAKPLKRF